MDKNNDVLHEQDIIDLYIQLNEFVQAEITLSEFEKDLSLYSEKLQLEIKDFATLKRWLFNILIKDGEIAVQKDLEILYDLALNGKGLAKYQGQNILCFFYGDCIEYEIDAEAGTKSQAQNSKINQTIEKVEPRLGVYPNPANEWVMIELEEDNFETFENVQLTIRDLTGKIVHQTQLNRNTYLWETEGISDGLYLITVSAGDYLTWNEKVILQH